MKARLYKITDFGYYTYLIIALDKRYATDIILAKQCTVNGQRDSSNLSETVDLTDNPYFSHNLWNNKECCDLVEKGIKQAIIIDRRDLMPTGFWCSE